MAKPIKETPVLKGRDADNFQRKMELSNSHKASYEIKAKIQKNFERLNCISKF